MRFKNRYFYVEIITAGNLENIVSDELDLLNEIKNFVELKFGIVGYS